jgi:hypothetical protein
MNEDEKRAFAKRVSHAAMEVLAAVLYAVDTPGEALETLLSAMVVVTLVMEELTGRDDSDMIITNIRSAFDAAKAPEMRADYQRFAAAARTLGISMREKAAAGGDLPRETPEARMTAACELSLYLASFHTDGPHESMEALLGGLVAVAVGMQDAIHEDAPSISQDEFVRILKLAGGDDKALIIQNARAVLRRGVNDRDNRKAAN